MTLMQASAQAQGTIFFLFLVLTLMFALQQVKTKCRSGTTHAQGYLPPMVCLANENTGSRFPHA